MSADTPLDLVPAREALLADLPSWFASREEQALWAGPTPPFPLDAAGITSLIAESRTEPPARLCFAGLIDGRLAAYGELALDPVNGVARLARIALAPACRGRGLAAPFLRQLMARLEAVGDYPRIELNVIPSNRRAIRLYESLGFRHDGTRRSAMKVGEARWDVAIYSILRPAAAGPGG